ncbi:MAG: hypothetical protein ACM3IJ_05500 [Candidatus Levyibacteriota bacterium]
MKKVLLTISIFCLLCTIFLPTAYAADDPLSRPNNFYGIHILFPSELEDAAKLVNSNGGSWGYVTIPIQSGDRDLEKWQNFMDDAARMKVIPILRLATQPDPFNTSVWRKPNQYDVLDFANFLSSLNWPTKNKYVILFNEVNRSDEWGGEYPDPQRYSDLVSYSHEVFKSKDPNFYLILSGMDDSAPNDYKNYINGFVYLQDLTSFAVQDKVDGFSSHSYPNPGFSSYPSENKQIGVASYKYEYAILNTDPSRKIPAFITETGWGSKSLPDSVVSKYFQMTFSQIWQKDADKIVAITPFLLKATGPFDAFSFFNNGKARDFYTSIFNMPKTKGDPEIEKATGLVKIASAATVKAESFKPAHQPKQTIVQVIMNNYLKKILGVSMIQ